MDGVEVYGEEGGAAAGGRVPGSGSARRSGRACNVADGNGGGVLVWSSTASVGVSGGEPNMQGPAGAVRGIPGPIQCGLLGPVVLTMRLLLLSIVIKLCSNELYD
jgi:hypothetical protein